MADRIKGITIELDGDTTKLTKALKESNREIKNSQMALRDIDKLLQLDPGNTQLLQQKFQYLGREIDATKNKLNTLHEAEKQALESGNMPADDFDKLQREIVETEQELKNLEQGYNELGNSASQQVEIVSVKMETLSDKMRKVGDSMQNVGDKMTNIGNTMTKSITVPIVAAGGVAVKSAADFEEALAKVSTIADETEVSADDMRKAILDLSNETGIGAAEIAESVYNAISAGQKTGDAVNFVSKAAKLSRAGFTSVASSLDIMTTTMNAYKMKASDVTRVSDVLIQTQNLGKTTVDELAASMGKAIPTAKSNGVELETLAGSYAVMTANGIATAETTTYLNSMMNELGKQGTSAANAFAEGTKEIKEGGLTMKEAMDMGWSLTDVLAVLEEQAALSGTTIQNMFGSAEAGKAANVLWDNAEKLDAAIKQMGDSAGSTQTAFDKMDTEGYRAKQTLNELKNVAIDVGSVLLEMLGPIIEQISDGVSNLREWWEGLDEEQQEFILKLAGIAAVAGPVITILGSLTSSIGSIVGAGSKVAGMFGSIGTAIGSIGNNAGTAASTVSTIGDAAGQAAGSVSSAGTAIGKLAQNAVGFLAVGAGILMAAGGIALLAFAAIKLAEAGPEAAFAMVALVGSIALLAAGAAALGPALTPAAPGLLAFGGAMALLGAAVALVGAGIFLAATGMSLMIDHMPQLITYGPEAAETFVLLAEKVSEFAVAAGVGGGAAIVLGDGLLLAAVGLAAMALAAIGMSGGAGLLAVSITALSAAIILFGEAILLATTNTVDAFNLIKSTIYQTLDNVTGKFTGTFNGIKGYMSGVLDWLKGIFNFKWSLPKIKLPHFSISGSFSLDPPSIPSIGVEWYRKAMTGGMILDSPTIFGMSRSGTLLGAGEAGSEAVVGTGALQAMITDSVMKAQGIGGDIIIPIYVGGALFDEMVIRADQIQDYRSGGR